MDFLKKLSFEKKKWLFEAYIAGLAFFIGIVLIAQTYIEVAVLLGIINAYFTEAIIDTFRYGNKSEYDFKKRTKFRLIKNILYSLMITSLIMISHYLFSRYVVKVPIEPISFGILYKLFDTLIHRIRVAMNLR